MFECDTAHRRPVAVLCTLYKISCNPVHPLYGALPEWYVPVRFTRGALVVHRYTYSIHRWRTSQYRRTFIPRSISLWYDLADPVFDDVELLGFKSRDIFLLFIGLATLSIFVWTIFPFLYFLFIGCIMGWGLRIDSV